MHPIHRLAACTLAASVLVTTAAASPTEPRPAATDAFLEVAYLWWIADAYPTDTGERECIAWTNDDLDNSFSVIATTSGGLRIRYDEPIELNGRPLLSRSDPVRLVVVGPREVRFHNVAVETGVGPDGRRFLTVSGPDREAPAMVRALHTGRQVRLDRFNRKTGKLEVVTTFNLAGFATGFEKIAEWCGIDSALLYHGR
ncbi:MAG: hypothetical protein H6983_08610 [Ectothiorhodospiraceae bacterium]|nr:hypothetical protein [Chromatiales bacterium]MCP5154210.1 hypothetical protein [Ectothiorhodospiraceae bacterium]